MEIAIIACQAGAPTTAPVGTSQPMASQTAVEQLTAEKVTELPPVASPAVTEIATQVTPTGVEKPAETPGASLPTLIAPQPGPEQLDLSKVPGEHGFSDFTEGYHMDMQWTDPQDAKQEANTTYSYRQQTLPVTAWYSLYDDNNPFLASKIESVVIGQLAFSSTPESGCQPVSADQLKNDDPRQPFRSLLAGLTGLAKRAEANVDLDGAPTDLYTLTAANLKPEAEIVLKAVSASSSGELTQAITTTFKLMEKDTALDSGKLYLAQQGGYVRRIELNYSKTASEEDAPFAKPGAKMERTLVYEVLVATAQDKPITMPAGCEGNSGGSGTGNNIGTTPAVIADLPRLPDTSNLVETEGSLVYQTKTGLEEVLDFYRNEMPALGWEKTDETVLGTLATFEFTRGEQTASITIMQTGDTVTVTIDLT
jgi:hypothetical protein